MATKKPLHGTSVIAPVSTCRARTPSTRAGCRRRSPRPIAWFHKTATLGFLNRRSCMIFSARKAVAADGISVTLEAKIRQEQRLFHGGVATADHHDLLPAG